MTEYQKLRERTKNIRKYKKIMRKYKKIRKCKKLYQIKQDDNKNCEGYQFFVLNNFYLFIHIF